MKSELHSKPSFRMNSNASNDNSGSNNNDVILNHNNNATSPASKNVSTAGNSNVNLLCHIDEAITAVIANSANSETTTTTVASAAGINNGNRSSNSGLLSNVPPKNHHLQQMACVSLGNPRTSNFNDLPENLLETSTTPPMLDTSVASASGAENAYGTLYSSSQGDTTPVLTSLTPINVDLTGLLPMETAKTGAHHHHHHQLATLNMTPVSSGLDSSGGGGLTQLFPMVPNNNSNLSGNVLVSSGMSQNSATAGMINVSSALPGYLAVKVEPQEVVIGGTVVSSGTVGSLMSSPQLSLGVTSGNSLNLTSISSAGEMISLQPAAVYVQPANHNGQVQFYKLDLSQMCSANVGNVSGLHSLQKLGNASSSVNTSSTVELANNLIATLLQQQQQQHQSNVGHDDTQVGEELIVTNETVVVTSGSDADHVSYTVEYPTDASGQPHPLLANVVKSNVGVKKRARSSSSGGLVSRCSPTEPTDEMDGIYIDTKDLCSRIAYELKAHSIPQAVFAERVLCRSQGTLSDLLRNPKPWNKLKSGRETFRRMYQWLYQPLQQRLASLEACKGAGSVKRDSADSHEEEDELEDEFDDEHLLSSSPDDGEDSTMALETSMPSSSNNNNIGNVQTSPRQEPQPRLVKKPRLVFTDIQKRTLQAIFKETQRPSREMQQTIAEHLGLDLSTVQNFFMNARRRSRIDQPQPDSPQPYQQIRPITPPPISPTSSAAAAALAAAGGGQTPTTPRNTAAATRQRGKTSATLASSGNMPVAAHYDFSGLAVGGGNAKIQLKIEPVGGGGEFRSGGPANIKAVLIEAPVVTTTSPITSSVKHMKTVS